MGSNLLSARIPRGCGTTLETCPDPSGDRATRLLRQVPVPTVTTATQTPRPAPPPPPPSWTHGTQLLVTLSDNEGGGHTQA